MRLGKERVDVTDFLPCGGKSGASWTRRGKIDQYIRERNNTQSTLNVNTVSPPFFLCTGLHT